MMASNGAYKNVEVKHSRSSRIQRFFRSRFGFRILFIIIGLIIIGLIEFGLIFVYIVGEVLSVNFLISFAQQQMAFFNNNGVAIIEKEGVDLLKSLLFRIGFLSLVFGILIGFDMETRFQYVILAKIPHRKYLTLILISTGILSILFSLTILF